MKANASGSEMMLASRCDSTSKSSGIRSAPSKASVASVVAAIASGKPTSSAIAERPARSARRCTIATHSPASGPNSGPTTIAPTTRISESRMIPIAAISPARTM